MSSSNIIYTPWKRAEAIRDQYTDLEEKIPQYLVIGKWKTSVVICIIPETKIDLNESVDMPEAGSGK